VVIELLTFRDVAARLRCSESTVERAARDGRLPVVRVGRAARVRPADLAAFIEGLAAGAETKETT
jgi:excisionase family DNA binding protein